MLRLDANTTLNQSYELFITLVNITYQSGGSASPFNPFLGQWPLVGVIYPVVFNFYLCIFFSLPAVVLNCFLCSACISKRLINLTSFLFKSKFLSFQICDSAHLLSHYYYCHNYYFCFYLLLLFFYMFCFAIIAHFHLFDVKISLILLLPSSSLSIFNLFFFSLFSLYYYFYYHHHYYYGFVFFFSLLIKQLFFSHETVKVSRLFCLFVFLFVCFVS